jgi:hypothetical protein
MAEDSGDKGRSQNGVVGAEGLECRYEVNRADNWAASVGVPQFRNACGA